MTPLPLVRPSVSSQGLFLLGVVWFYNGYFVFIHVVVDVDLSSFLFSSYRGCFLVSSWFERCLFTAMYPVFLASWYVKACKCFPLSCS
jgi:hypothetical protein